jgi:ABC-type spermidine/putrescine transport system permease subunit II
MARFDRPRTLWVVAAFVLLLLFAPVVVVIVYSFNATRSLVNMGGLSLQWYREALTSSDWHASLWVSIEIALVTTLICAVFGTMLAFALERGSPRTGRVTEGTIIVRLLSPETATAIATLLLFTQVGLTLSRSTIALGHVAVCLPFVAVIVRSRIASLNPEMERSAMDLGATRLQALWLVVMPVIWPAIASAAMLVFVLSFDDFITTVFTSGAGVPPLPLRIYGVFRTGITPVVNAVGVLMMIVTTIALVSAVLLARLARRRMSVSQGRVALEPVR